MSQPQLQRREARIALPGHGLSLYLRNKRPAALARPTAQRTVLFVHGATYPASVAFDLALDGRSWMDVIAARGFDVWLLDLPGYGRSDRPAEMDRPAKDSAPIVTTDVAIASVAAAVEHICAENGIETLNLIGWSWGTAIMGGYTQQNPARVEKLTLFAPLWTMSDAPALADTSSRLGAWRGVPRDEMKARWLRGVPADAIAALAPAAWMETFFDAAFASDPTGAAMTTPRLRAPNGVIADVMRFWTQGQPTWDPAAIRCPTLIVIGEWDADTPPAMAQAIFAKLVNARTKQLTLIGRATHTMALESNRDQLFAAVQSFLES